MDPSPSSSDLKKHIVIDFAFRLLFVKNLQVL